ncbi:MAG: hypothetical protein ACM3PP_00115 [Candidatus Saccharibacteria bacterium]
MLKEHGAGVNGLSKLNFRKNEERLPDYFIAAVVGWDRDEEKALVYVDLRGYVHIDQMTPEVPGTVFIKKGAMIPGTKQELQADNYARRLVDLNTDWDGFACLMHAGNPVQ